MNLFSRFNPIRIQHFLALTVMIVVAGCSGSSGDSATGQSGGGSASVGEVVPAQQKRIIPTEEGKPYRPDGQYASVMMPCMLVPDADSICKLSRLPYIGQTTNNVTIDDVMARVLTTHDWMGVRLETMLQQLPSEMLQLFASVTVIAIGSDVRPARLSLIHI